MASCNWLQQAGRRALSSCVLTGNGQATPAAMISPLSPASSVGAAIQPASLHTSLDTPREGFHDIMPSPAIPGTGGTGGEGASTHDRSAGVQLGRLADAEIQLGVHQATAELQVLQPLADAEAAVLATALETAPHMVALQIAYLEAEVRRERESERQMEAAEQTLSLGSSVVWRG